MKVLIACEFSGIVRDAFAALGHQSWSCDLLPSEKIGRHIVGDVLEYLGEGWDLLIAHPPCTHLAVSGARWFKEKQDDQRKAIDFFLALANAPVERVALENPVCIMSRLWRKPDQVLQPWQFGHGETKATCLWLKNLPPLCPTHIDDDWFAEQTPKERVHRVHQMAPSPTRGKDRSRTYEGMAKAMAEQWS